MDLLVAALRADQRFRSVNVGAGNMITAYDSIAGSYINITRTGDVLSVDTTESTATDSANAINRAYSGEVVRRSAKKFGWKLTETKTGAFRAVKAFTFLLALLVPALAHAHHEEIVRQTAVTLDLGWPIIVAVVGALVAQIRSWWS